MTAFLDSWLLTIAIVGLALYGFVKLLTDRSSHDKDMAILWVLMSSCDDDGMYAMDICKITGVPHSGIYPRLAKLESRGLVTFTRDTDWPHRFRYHVDADFKLHHLSEEELTRKERT
jgi:hypothetical protein